MLFTKKKESSVLIQTNYCIINFLFCICKKEKKKKLCKHKRPFFWKCQLRISMMTFHCLDFLSTLLSLNLVLGSTKHNEGENGVFFKLNLICSERCYWNSYIKFIIVIMNFVSILKIPGGINEGLIISTCNVIKW